MNATVLDESTEPYRRSAEQVVVELHTDPQHGLRDAEVRARLITYGKNELTAEQPVPTWRKFLAQFQDVLVILLPVATAISAACGSGSWASSSAAGNILLH